MYNYSNEFILSQRLRSPLVKRKKFPYQLAVACTSINTSKYFNSLSRTAKGILAFLTRLAECTNPMKPSWAFKSTMAHELGVSESTIYRGLRELAKAGLIERLNQERKSHNGRLTFSKIRLTLIACKNMRLIRPNQSIDPIEALHIKQPKEISTKIPSKNQVIHNIPSAKMTDGYLYPPSGRPRTIFTETVRATPNCFLKMRQPSDSTRASVAGGRQSPFSPGAFTPHETGQTSRSVALNHCAITPTGD